MALPSSSVGRKLVMAISGQVMIVFVIIHVLGNATIFAGGLNAYAAKLHALVPLVWATRLAMLAAVILHLYFSIQLTLENRKAKPGTYAVSRHQRSTFASRNMIWTGVIIGMFLIYHLLHFTLQIISPGTSAGANLDTLGRPDVAGMVIAGFQNMIMVLFYAGSMAALLFHLIHGIQSSFQTLGLSNERTEPVVADAGSIAAVILFLGYIAIPVLVILGLMKG